MSRQQLQDQKLPMKDVEPMTNEQISTAKPAKTLEGKQVSADAGHVAKLCGIDMKWVSLVALTFQTTLQVFVIKFARAGSSVERDVKPYLNSSVVLFAEMSKLVFSFLLLVLEMKSIPAAVDVLRSAGFRETLKLGVPALAYVIQNNLMFYSLDTLSAAVQQVTYQLKILVAALLSVILLGKEVSRLKWAALYLLVAGVIMVQYPRDEATAMSPQFHPHAALGLLAVILACFSSGFAGVYMEMMLKQGGASIWTRNIQLSIFGTFAAAGGAIIRDGNKILEGGLTQGYSERVLLAIFTVASGGLLCAAALKYADNILRQFATALSIIITSLMSWTILRDFEPDLMFVLGAMLTICATFVYNLGLPVWLLGSCAWSSKC